MDLLGVLKAVKEAERAGFEWKAVDGKITKEECERFYEFSRQFLPKPHEYRYYQIYQRCHSLAGWQQELGRLAFPHLTWKIMRGEAHSLTYATDRVGSIKIVMDILNFKDMSAMELIEYASQKAELPED